MRSIVKVALGYAIVFLDDDHEIRRSEHVPSVHGFQEKYRGDKMTQTNSSIGIRQLLDMQKQAFIEEAAVGADVRMQRIQQVIDMLVEHKEELCQAMGEDFGGRPPCSRWPMTFLARSPRSSMHAITSGTGWVTPNAPASNPLTCLAPRPGSNTSPRA